MAFALVQTSGDTIAPIDNFSAAQTINAWTGATNFVVGNLVVVKITHYSGAASDTLSCTINGLAATKLERQNPTNTVNAALIFYAVVATGGSRNVVLTPSAGTDHYISVDVEEYSFSGTLSLVGGAATGADGNSAAPSADTGSGAASGDLGVGVTIVADTGTRTITSTAPASATLGFNEGDSGLHQAGAGASKILSSGGAQAFSWTYSTTAIWTVLAATFSQTGGGAVSGTGQATRPVRAYSFGGQRFRGPSQPQLGRGTLQPSANPAVAFSGSGDAALSPFAASAAGSLTFAASGSAAMVPFAADGTGSGPSVAISAPWAQPQPLARGWGRPSRLPAPPVPRLGQGVQRADPFGGYSGSASVEVSPAAVTAAGLLTFAGSGSAAASPFATSSAGAEAFAGSGSAAASPFATSSAGAEAFAGSGSAALAPFACSGSGLETFAGSGSATMAPFASTGSGAELFTGSASAACQPFAASGSATSLLAITSSGSAAMSPFAVAGNGATGTVFTSSGSAAASTFATSSIGAETFAGTGSSAASAFACAGTGTSGSGFVGSGSVALAPLAASGSGIEAFSGSASAALSPFTAAGSGGLAFTGAGSAAASPFGATSVGFLGDFTSVGSVAMSAFAGTAIAVNVPPPLPYRRVASAFAPVVTPTSRII